MEADPRGWVALWPMPNLNLSASIVRGDAGMLHMKDQRLARLQGQQEALEGLLGRFTDEFGQKIRPGVMAFREGASAKLVTIEGMSAFRDAICIASLTIACAVSKKGTEPRKLLFRCLRFLSLALSQELGRWRQHTNSRRHAGNARPAPFGVP